MPPWPPRPALALGFPRLLAGPWLWSHGLGNPGFFSREGPAHSSGQERRSAWHQLQGGLNLSTRGKAQATALGMWTMRRVPLGRMTRGPSTRQRGEGPSMGSPRREAILGPGIPGSWHKAAPRTGHVRKTPPGHSRKREMPFLEQQGGETLEKAVFGKRKDHRTANR